jgi:MFS transporter, DHA2 family, multidrug resistance protein
VPSISRDLQPTASQLLWITDIYGFLLAGFLIPMCTWPIAWGAGDCS